MKIDCQDILISDLIDTEDISVRAINVCKCAGFFTINNLIEFFNENGNFKTIRNCGGKTEDELITLFEKYKHILDPGVIHDFKTSNEDTALTIIKLNPFQKSILKRHVDYLILNLSVRARNGLMAIKGEPTTQDLLERVISDRPEFKKIKNIGKKTVDELNLARFEIQTFVDKLQKIPSDQLSKEYAKLVLYSGIKDFEEISTSVFPMIFDNNNKIKLFTLINLLIESDKLFNKNEKTVFSYIYSDSDIYSSLENIATRLSLTRERVRQIKTKLKEEIDSYFLFVSNFTCEDIVSYGINEADSFQIINKPFADKINETEAVHFNTQFYSVIYSIFFKKTHIVLDNIERLTDKKRSTLSNNSQTCYLIIKYLFEAFRFEDFIKDIYSKLSKKTWETYDLHFKGYASLFLINDNKKYLDIIFPICEQIIYNEFELLVNSNGYLTFERTTRQQVHEYCYEILNENSNPMTVENIWISINEKYPGFKTTTDSIRGSLNREKELFIFFGRSSTYGLRKWESEKTNFKGGTIRDIVEEYLNELDYPQTIEEIVRHVLKYRNTNHKSILANLKMDESKRFYFFKNSVIGLTKKVYSEKYQELDAVNRNWDEKFEDLKSFQINNDRWPNSNSSEKEEVALYLFGYRLRRAYITGKLDEQKASLLKDINYPLVERSTRANDWYEDLEKLEKFIILNQRQPNANSIDKSEKALYRFVYKNRRLIQANELDEDKLLKLNELKLNSSK